MPLEVDARRTFPYVLIEDRALPEPEQRALLFRFVSARDDAKINAAFQGAFVGAESDTVVVARVLDGVRVGLVGWRGFKDDAGSGVPYDPADLDAVLTTQDVMDLHVNLRAAMAGTEMDRKKVALRQPTGPAASADAAPAAGA